MTALEAALTILWQEDLCNENLKKIATARLLAIILLLAVCTAGCAAPTESNGGVPSETDAPAESDGSGAPADAPQALTLPILDEIDADVTVGTAGFFAAGCAGCGQAAGLGREYGP